MLQIDKFSLKKPATLATTYLNISAVLSNMGKYPESYKLAKKANQMFLQLKEEQLSRLGTTHISDPESGHQAPEGDKTTKISFVASYFNMAIAAEWNGNKKLALEHASQGYHFALLDLGPEEQYTIALKDYFEKLAFDIAQGMAVRPPPKPRREEPSSRQHDTSYLSGKMSEGGLHDLTGFSGKQSHGKSQRDKSMYNPEGRPASLRAQHRDRPGRQALSPIPEIQG